MSVSPPLLASSAAPTTTVSFAHWNPHYECFLKEPTCRRNATASLARLLASGCSPTGCANGGLDFASVIEFEVADYEPPAGWESIGLAQTCGHDWATLFYDARRWKVSAWSTGCLAPGRSFAAGVFAPAGGGVALTVASAHFPQTQHNASAYAEATATLRAVLARLGAHKPEAATVLLADTNTESPQAAASTAWHNSSGGVNKTNAALLSDLGLWASPDEPPAAPLFKGCCCTPFFAGDTPFSWEGDRIVANAGSPASSRVLFDPPPAWACSEELRNATGSEFHKGVAFDLVLPAARSVSVAS